MGRNARALARAVGGQPIRSLYFPNRAEEDYSERVCRAGFPALTTALSDGERLQDATTRSRAGQYPRSYRRIRGACWRGRNHARQEAACWDSAKPSRTRYPAIEPAGSARAGEAHPPRRSCLFSVDSTSSFSRWGLMVRMLLYRVELMESIRTMLLHRRSSGQVQHLDTEMKRCPPEVAL
jgi:hypothetical protein